MPHMLENIGKSNHVVSWPELKEKIWKQYFELNYELSLYHMYLAMVDT